MWHLKLVFQTYFRQQRAKALLVLYNLFLDISFEYSRWQLSFPPQVFLMQVLALSQQTSVLTCFCVGDAKLYYYRHYSLAWHQGRTPTLVMKWIWKQEKKNIYRWPMKWESTIITIPASLFLEEQRRNFSRGLLAHPWLSIQSGVVMSASDCNPSTEVT